MNKTSVLALLPLFVVLAHSFHWEIVVGAGKRLKFYNNGVLMHTEDNPSSKDIYSVTYDPVQYRVLFADYQDGNLSISSFDLTTRKKRTLVTRLINPASMALAYDPLTQLLFWDEAKKIYSMSLKSASSNTAVARNFILILSNDCRAIAVDSCGGYIYWANVRSLERAAFDGSERELLMEIGVFAIHSLAIDQQTRTMYWCEETTPNRHSIKSADLNGNNVKTYFIGSEYMAAALAISNDFIYWRSYNQRAILQLSKHQHGVAPIVYVDSSTLYCHYQLIATNYTIKEQSSGMKSCEALKNILSNPSVKNSSDVSLDGSTCHYYCFKGNCSITAEGHPKCRCEAGYSGERCEVNACYKHCLHGGVCFLNEEEKPVCQCTADYEGERCDVVTSHIGACVAADKTTQQILLEVKQVREDLQCTLQLYSDKLDENAVKIQICEESMNDDLRNHDESTSETQTSNMKF